MCVFLLEQRDPPLERSHERQGAADAHVREQCVGHLHAADAPAFGFDEHRPRGIESTQRFEQLALEPFLRRLRIARQVA